MVDLGSKGPYGQSFDNTVFILPGICIIAIVAFCGWKLYNSIKEKEERKLRGGKDKKNGKAK